MLRTLAAIVGALSIGTTPVYAQTERATIAGRVVDETQHPVAHALVQIHDHGDHVQAQTKTDGEGHYTLRFSPDSASELQVIPPFKSGLAQALIHDLPAIESRHLVVRLSRGFAVRGRVVCDGKPFAGARVIVSAEDGDTVHGGGTATSGYHGPFAMVLTAGNKVFEVSCSPTRSSQHKLAITRDAVIPDLWIGSNIADKP